MPPINKNQLLQMITTEARAQGVDPHLATSIAFDGEGTTGDPFATSPKGAQGIFQLMPDTAKEVGVTDSLDPVQNIRGGVAYLKKLSQMFPGDIERIAAAYNAGPGTVRRHGGTPPYKETQAYVQRVKAGYQTALGLQLPTTAQSRQFTSSNYTSALQTQIASRDPRQPVIDLGLRIMGKTRSDFGSNFNDPAFVDNFYRATMQHAEGADATLTITEPGKYNAVLERMAQAAELKRQPQVQGPPAPKAESAGGWVPTSLGEIGDAMIQTVRGVAVDPMIGLVKTAEDLTALAERPLMAMTPDWVTSLAKNLTILPGTKVGDLGPKPSETLEKYIDNILGQPQTTAASVTRKLASFISPFLGAAKALRVAGMGKAAANVVGGAIANTAFLDPDSPAVTEMIYNWSLAVNPQDPEQLRSRITRYLAGDESQHPEINRLVGRTFNGVEGVLVDVAVNTILPFLKANKATKDAIVKEADAIPFNPAAGGKAANEIEIAAKDVKIAPDLPASAQPGVKGAASKAQAAEMAAETRVNKNVAMAVDVATESQDITARVAPELPEHAKPGMNLGWSRPQMAKQIDDVVENVEALAKGETPKPLTPVDHAPELSPQQAMSAADEAIESGLKGMEADIQTRLDKVVKLFEDPTNQKIALALMLKGTVGGMISAELVDPFEAGAADNTTDRHTRSLANFLVGMGVVTVGGTAAAIKLARKLRASALADDVGKAATGLKLAPPSRIAGPGHAFIRDVEPGRADWSTVVKLKNGRTVDVRLDHVRDAQDYQELVSQFQRMLPDDAAAVQAMMPVKIEDTMRLAHETAMSPEALRVLQRTTTPQQYSKDIATTYYLAKASQQTVHQLSTRIAQGELGLGDEWLRQVALLAESGKGLLMGRSDMGRALNVLRQASDGTLDQFIEVAGAMTTTQVKSEQAIKNLALKFAGMTPEGMAQAAKDMYQPTRLRALGEVLINGLLATPAGAGKQLLGDGRRIFMEMIGREFAALEAKTRELLGYEVVQGSPYLGEPLVMLQSILGSLTGATRAASGIAERGESLWRAVGRTLRTGEQHWADHAQGVHRVGSAPQPQFVAEAFGWENRVLEATGVNAAYRATMDKLGLPHAATVIDAAGNWIRTAGMRLRVTADEAVQYMIHNMELDAYAYRASLDAGLTGDAADAFMREFRANPPEHILKQIQYEKKSLTYMNSLMDERGGFAGLRQAVGHWNQATNSSTLARIQMPFLRTHMNLLTSVLEHTPGVNLMSPNFRAELTSADPIIRSAAQGKLWSGLAVAITGAYLGAQGIVIGPITTDPALLEEMRRAGREPNSIRIGDTNVKLDVSEPLGFILQLTGSIGAGAWGDQTPEEMGATASAIVAAAELFTQAPVVEAFGDLTKALDTRRLERQIKSKDDAEVIGQTLDSIMLRPYLPPLVFQNLQKIIEPHKQVADTWFQRVANRTPGGQSGTTETDIMGRPRFVGGQTDGSTVTNFARFIFPVDWRPVVEDPLDKAMVEKGVVIRDPRPIMTVQNVDVPLAKTEVQKLKDIMAQPPGWPKLYDTLKRLTEDPKWKTLSPELAQQATADVVGQYTRVARAVLLSQSPDIQERLKARAQEIRTPLQ